MEAEQRPAECSMLGLLALPVLSREVWEPAAEQPPRKPEVWRVPAGPRWTAEEVVQRPVLQAREFAHRAA